MNRSKTTRKNYTFSAPFNLTGFDQSFPAGLYILEITEEMMEGMSFVAFKHTATTMHAIDTHTYAHDTLSPQQLFNVDPRDFELAILKDRQQCADHTSTKDHDADLSRFDRRAIEISENEGMTNDTPRH